MSSTIQYSSGSQLACHWRSRFPVRLLPSCTTICACCSSLVALALPNQRSAHGSGCPVCDSIVANQRPAKSLRPQCNFFALFHSCARQPPRRAFCRQKNQSRCFSLSRRGRFTQPRFVVLPPVAQPLLPANPGVVHFAIQRFSKRAVDMDSTSMKRTESVVDGRNQPTCGDILGRARQ